MEIDVSAEHLQNASQSIVRSPSGRDTDVMRKQPAKAFSSMVVVPDGTVTAPDFAGGQRTSVSEPR